MLKAYVAPKGNIYIDNNKFKVDYTTYWVKGSSTYTTEHFIKVCTLLMVTHLHKDKLPSSPRDHTELDSSPLLGE